MHIYLLLWTAENKQQINSVPENNEQESSQGNPTWIDCFHFNSSIRQCIFQTAKLRACGIWKKREKVTVIWHSTQYWKYYILAFFHSKYEENKFEVVDFQIPDSLVSAGLHREVKRLILAGALKLLIYSASTPILDKLVLELQLSKIMISKWVQVSFI